jgi:hypothetical protein
MRQLKRTPFPSTAGILTIIGSCITITLSILLVAGTLYIVVMGYFGISPARYLYNLIAGIFGIIAFAFGLTGGIFALRRRRIALSIFGISLLITSGIMMSLPFWVMGYTISNWVWGLPIVILSVLSVIFVAVSKGEFS